MSKKKVVMGVFIFLLLVYTFPIWFFGITERIGDLIESFEEEEEDEPRFEQYPVDYYYPTIITYTEMMSIIRNQLKNPRTKIPLDARYRSVNKERLRRFAWRHRPSPYVKDFFDCDDQAFEFVINYKKATGETAIGVVILQRSPGATHAMVFIVDEHKQVWLLDNDFMRLEPPNKIHRVEVVII